jgi:hypothetical protein
VKLVRLFGNRYKRFRLSTYSDFSSTQYRNCDISESVNGANESNILQILFNKAHLPPVRSYGTIGDPKVSR